jgi:phage protein D
MATFTMARESAEQGHFYVPQFEIRIQGKGLDPAVLRDVREVRYHDKLTEIDGFEMTVNNWDPQMRDFKYVGSETVQSLTEGKKESVLQRMFEPGENQVELYIGYLNKLQLMMKGSFTRLDPNFVSGGGPTLNVSALNLLHRFRDKQHTKVFTNKRDSEIAEDFKISDPQTGKKLAVKADSNAKKVEQQIPYIAQNNMYDIDFLLWRARKRGYVVVLQEAETDTTGKLKHERQIYFGPSEQAGLRDATVELGWGKSLMEFKPSLTTANQVKAVTVRGWNRATKKPISERVTVDDPEIKQNTDLHRLLKKGVPREEEVVNEPVFSPGEARQRALSILKDRLRDMVTASATCVGLPDLRAGREVEITGIGARFSGTYFITDTTHTLGVNGYITRFNARRLHAREVGAA